MQHVLCDDGEFDELSGVDSVVKHILSMNSRVQA